MSTTPDLVADATAPIPGAEPEIIETTLVGEPPAAIEQRPLQNELGQPLIAGSDLTVVPLQNELEQIAQLAVTVAGSVMASYGVLADGPAS